MSLAIWQAVRGPHAGGITLVWLGLGFVLYKSLFAFQAQVMTPPRGGRSELIRMRSRSPLMWPVRNPQTARALVQLASVLTPPQVGKVMLLSVNQSSAMNPSDEIDASLAPLRAGLEAAHRHGHAPFAMTTSASDPWAEIARVAAEQGSERLLLGLTDLTGPATVDHLESLVNRVGCDLSILRAPSDWDIGSIKKVLVPVGGRGKHDQLRAGCSRRWHGLTALKSPYSASFSRYDADSGRPN